jgi:geranylgeranyl diphosphate synthase type II
MLENIKGKKMNFKDKYQELLLATETFMMEQVPDKEPSYLYEPFRYVISAGGKRIRPVLALLSAAACGADWKRALPVAAAIEILHNFTLVHDDIMDNSPFRRGRETVHKKWDEPTAILTGDIMIAWAYKILQSNHPRNNEICAIFTKGFIEVNEGQGYDMLFNEKKDTNFEDYLLMIKKKTAALLMTPAAMGAHIAEANMTKQVAMVSYALNLGLAFQIQDDYLDMTADEAELGKKTGLDIVEGKKTCLIIKANEKELNSEDRALMDRYYSENGLPMEYVPKMSDIFQKYGVYDEIQNIIELYFARAKNDLNDMPKNDYTDMLIWLADSLNKRKK